MKVRELFARQWTLFWATTYTLELELFDGFLFRRLGDPPLNATVLADHFRLTDTWSRIAESGELSGLRRVNREYLVRGLALGSGSFHPKTYLFANARQARLLVGSGNLTMNGLDRGHECFSTFASETRVGTAAIQAWMRWMDELVSRVGDPLLTQRWLDAQGRLLWLGPADATSPFVTNLDQPLLDQFIAAAGSDVDELHVLAPFFDERAGALERLLSEVRPLRLVLYVARGMSVDGASLRQVVSESNADLRVVGYTPDEGIHAKLLGAIKGDAGHLLSGSANMSHAALVGKLGSQPWANVEAGVLLATSGDELRAAYAPPGLTAVDLSREALEAYSFEADGARPILPLKLLAATREPDGRLRVRHQPDQPVPAALQAAAGRFDLDQRLTTTVVEERDETRLVWLVDDAGNKLSNELPVDDPAALRSQLTEREKSSGGVEGLNPEDMDRPEARLLAELNNSYEFDIDQIDRAVRAKIGADKEEPTEADADFWRRLIDDELAIDPRRAAYERFEQGAALVEDDVFTLLRLMLERVPGEGLPSPPEPREGADGKGTGSPWTDDARVQVRLANVLIRWSRGVDDPRLTWISPYAPVRNWIALVKALASCLIGDGDRQFLATHRVKQIAEILYGGFVGSRDGKGYFLRLPEDEREKAQSLIEPEDARLAAALLYAVLPAKWQSDAFAWQEFLIPGLELGVIDSETDADRLAAVLLGKDVPQGTVAGTLEKVANYEDEAHWREAILADYGLDVRFRPESMAGARLLIELPDTVDLLRDARVVPVVRRALEFKKRPGATVGRDENRRLSIKIGEPLYANIDGRTFSSGGPMTLDEFAELERINLPLGELMSEERAAS